MTKIKDFLLDTGFKKNQLKTPYKLLWMGCFLIVMLLFFVIFGDNGAIGAAIYAGFSYYLGKGMFFLIVRIFKMDIYYSQEELDKINNRKKQINT